MRLAQNFKRSTQTSEGLIRGSKCQELQKITLYKKSALKKSHIPKCTQTHTGHISPEMVYNGPKLNLSLSIISDIIR